MTAGAQATLWHHQCGGEVGECGDSAISLVMEFGTNLLLKELQNYFLKTEWLWKYVKISHGFYLSKMVLKGVLAEKMTD